MVFNLLCSLFRCCLFRFLLVVFFFYPFRSFLFVCHIMSIDKQVDVLLSEARGSTAAKAEASLNAAKLEIQKVLTTAKNFLYG